MSFCKFSSEYVAQNTTAIDNLFINAYLPYAPDSFIKVYVYGLAKCHNADSFDNTLERFCKILNMKTEEVEEAFSYWQDLGLVQILSTTPFEIRYIPTKSAIAKTKKISGNKYEDFNAQVEQLIKGRMPSPTEFFEYYSIMESMHIEIPAMIQIIKYCTVVKGENVGYPYIVAVAKNWAYEGVRTATDVENRLKEYEQNSNFLGELMSVMGIKRLASIEEKELLKKWLEQDFEENIILFVAKNIKKSKKRCNFELLDSNLSKYFEMKLFSQIEIENYEQNKQQLYKTAKDITKSLGLYYENLEPVVDNYITKWDSLGYDTPTLTTLANYCFKNSIRTLEQMDSQIQKLFKLGIVSEQSLGQYMGEIVEENQQIKQVLEKLGLYRNVNSYDREIYFVWTKDWEMPQELINHALELANGKTGPMQYANKILATWHTNNVKTIEQAKNIALPQSNSAPQKQSKRNYKNREYSKQDL
ncbi:MAG: DnaD domain protein, partial [Clostridia bacterium]|nr:DnaD domain protein [Clostridia bacterium]